VKWVSVFIGVVFLLKRHLHGAPAGNEMENERQNSQNEQYVN
jgi:hypothetical protein